jgi:hypothetical protein
MHILKPPNRLCTHPSPVHEADCLLQHFTNCRRRRGIKQSIQVLYQLGFAVRRLSASRSIVHRQSAELQLDRLLQQLSRGCRLFISKGFDRAGCIIDALRLWVLVAQLLRRYVPIMSWAGIIYAPAR